MKITSAMMARMMRIVHSIVRLRPVDEVALFGSEANQATTAKFPSLVA